jgi:homoserine/homoserine lactone efflux protein
MIEIATIIAFIAASAALIAVPGPNIAVIVATSLERGTSSGISVVLVMLAAQAVQIALVVAGLAAILSAFSWIFVILKWAGVAYLVWIGVLALTRSGEAAETTPSTSLRVAIRGAATALANPKTLLFHAAFLPLFVSPEAAALPQLLTLGILYLSVALVIDSGYAFVAGIAHAQLKSENYRRLIQRVSGVALLSAAGWLATRRVA